MSSAFYMDKRVLAVAFTENELEDVVSIEVYSTSDVDKITAESDRMRFKLPKIA